MFDVTRPNLYQLKGNQFEVILNMTADGVHPFSLQFMDHTKRKNDIYQDAYLLVQKTEIGQLVTVMLEAVPDLETVHFSVLIPPINLAGDMCDVQTEGILTTKRTSIAGEQLVDGQINIYHRVLLTGTAQVFR